MASAATLYTASPHILERLHLLVITFLFASLLLSSPLLTSPLLSSPLFDNEPNGHVAPPTHLYISLSLHLLIRPPSFLPSVCSTTFPLTVTAQMINPQDNTLVVQAAIKNLATNGVFYFGIPVAMEVGTLSPVC